jgi:catalase (peroxidase I)
VQWTNDFFVFLASYDFVKITGPGNAPQWVPVQKTGGPALPPDVGAVGFLTTDVALIEDQIYLEIVTRFANDIELLGTAFSHAWYKLMSSDMGPRSRCLDVDVPGLGLPPPQPFQLPLPDPPSHLTDFQLVQRRIRRAMSVLSLALEPDITAADEPYYGALFVQLAWQCSSTFRATDHFVRSSCPTCPT